MKFSSRLTFLVAGLVMLVLSLSKPAQAQEAQPVADTLNAVPPEVLVILKKGCYDCHAEPGKTMALTHVNFTKWNEYTAEKQASKARGICEQVTKGDMPPKKYREYNPSGVPTAEELKILCDWVAKYQESEKK